MGRKKLPLQAKYGNAAFLYSLMQLFPSKIKLSLPHAMLSKGFTGRVPVLGGPKNDKLSARVAFSTDPTVMWD